MTILLEDVIDMPNLVIDWWEKEGCRVFVVEPTIVYLSKKILEERIRESNH